MRRRFSHQKKVEERCEEAIIRQEKRDKLSNSKQLMLLSYRRGHSKREATRLNNKIQKKLQEDRKENKEKK